MKNKYFVCISILIFCIIISGITNLLPVYADNDILVGISWGDSCLVSFDPYAGIITEVHAQLPPWEAFRGLAYDPNHNKIYALAQSSNNLYSIDPVSLDILHIGNLHIDKGLSWSEDAGALAYDYITDTLYTVVEHWDSDYKNMWSELCIINVNNAELTKVGNINGPFITSLAYNEQDGQLYGLAIYGSGSWDSPYKSYVVRINPSNAVMVQLFETPYHTMLGFAKKPGEDSYIYYSWINWTTHFYGEVNLQTGTITPLGDADQVDVISAMVYKDFYIGSVPLLPTEENPISFLFTGHVTNVLDPGNLFFGGVNIGDIFTGEFSYDINGLINHTNMSAPYGVSVRINDIIFSHVGFYPGISNNYYDYYNDSVYDSFSFGTEDDEYMSISWRLRDHSLKALSNNIFLPDNFDLSAWDENDFILYKCTDEECSTLSGVVDAVNRLEPDISASPTSIDFGNIKVGQSSASSVITISNTGTADLHISGMSLSDTTNYTLDVNGGTTPCGNTTPTITPDGNCTVTITFSPLSIGQKDASLTVNSDDPDNPNASVVLTGVAVMPPLTLLLPNGGEIIPSGSTFNIQWSAPSTAVKFALWYRLAGEKWKLIVRDVTGTGYEWTVPIPVNNKKKCFVKVTGYNAFGSTVAEDISDAPFMIEVIRVLSPNEKEVLTSGSIYNVTWQINGTRNPVEKIKLFYTKDGGATWQPIVTLTGNPGSYDWTVPSVRRIKRCCKVKVVVGNTMIYDVSDRWFTIRP